MAAHPKLVTFGGIGFSIAMTVSVVLRVFTLGTNKHLAYAYFRDLCADPET